MTVARRQRVATARQKAGALMSSLTSGPLSDVLNGLLAAAAEQHGGGRHRVRTGRPRQEEHAPGDYRAEFKGAEQRFMAVSPKTGQLLYTLIRSSRAQAAVEFGTSFGVSTLFIAAGLKDNGGGRLIGTEFEPTKVDATRQSVERAGVDDIVEIRAGDALQTLSVDLPGEIDLVLLDGAKDMYLDIFRLLEPRLTLGALVLADNAARSDTYRQHIRASGGYTSTGIDELDLEISCRTG
jgi:predicted O-methyltransferase YrrM